MIHLRVVASPSDARAAIDLLCRSDSVSNVVHLPNSVSSPSGDLIMCDVTSEEASVVVSALRDLRVHEHGSISLAPIDSQISRDGMTIESSVRLSDAVVWEEVESRTSEMTGISVTYLVFLIAAVLIAGTGIIEGSSILIVGSMIVGPDFGPVAGTCVALVERRRGLAARSILSLTVGFSTAVAVSVVVSLALRAGGAFPAHLNEASANLPTAVSSVVHAPDFLSFYVALVAGVIGVLSLSTAKSGALIGVLVSVTTIPAAGNIALAASYAQTGTALGSLAQLGVNLATLILAGTTTLTVQRGLFNRSRRQSQRPRPRN